MDLLKWVCNSAPVHIFQIWQNNFDIDALSFCRNQKEGSYYVTTILGTKCTVHIQNDRLLLFKFYKIEDCMAFITLTKKKSLRHIQSTAKAGSAKNKENPTQDGCVGAGVEKHPVTYSC